MIAQHIQQNNIIIIQYKILVVGYMNEDTMFFTKNFTNRQADLNHQHMLQDVSERRSR